MNDSQDSTSGSLDSERPAQNELGLGIVGAAAIAMCAVFFCPWVMFIHFPLSGFDMAKSGGDSCLFALVPLGALWALFADAMGSRVLTAKIVAGAIPLLLFAYYYCIDLINLFEVLQPGGYGLLGISVFMILAPCRTRARSVRKTVDTSSAD
jgi:hypothetical protein